MNRKSAWNAILPVVAILGCLAYILACRPSWSPDGSKVLYTVGHKVAIYDCKTKSNRFLSLPNLGIEENGIPRAQWSHDGKGIVIAFVAGDQNTKGAVVVAPADAPERARLVVQLPLADYISPALPEVDGKLYLGGDRLLRIDLASGKIDERKGKEGQQAYMLALSRKGIHVLHWRQNNPQSNSYVLGMVDTETLAIKPLLTLKQDDVGENFLFAVSDDGSQTALSRTKEKEQKILLVAGSKVTKTITLKVGSEKDGLTSMEWSRDGKTLYGTLLEKDSQTNQTVCKLCEITVDSGRVRKSPIGTFRALNEQDVNGLAMALRAPLSPDGKTLALTTTGLPGEEDAKEGALFLVDLTSPQRTVVRIAPPTP